MLYNFRQKAYCIHKNLNCYDYEHVNTSPIESLCGIANETLNATFYLRLGTFFSFHYSSKLDYNFNSSNNCINTVTTMYTYYWSYKQNTTGLYMLDENTKVAYLHSHLGTFQPPTELRLFALADLEASGR
jgi:hypothetical protein